jgi:hypothetical protein
MLTAYADEARERILADIKRCGRHLIGVGGTDETLPFTYTIGNWRRSLPELLVIGDGAAGFLNDLSAQMLKRGKGFAFGEVVRLPKYLPDGFRVKVIDANATAQAEYTIQAGVFYGHDDYQVQQVMIPDLRWHFPDDPLYYARLRQPVLRKH